MNFFSKNLKYICKLFRVRQEELALHLGVSQTTVGNWQNDKSQPNASDLLGIKQYFGISIDDLLELDIEKGKLISEEVVSNFRAKGNLKGKGIGKLNRQNVSQNYDSGVPHNAITEEDKITNWLLLNELKNISQRLGGVEGFMEKISGKK